MSAFENRLVFACKQVGEASAEVLEWIDTNKGLVGPERVSLLHEFYRAEAQAERLATAVNQMPATAFVGPSRSGKTQVITSMIEQGRGRLTLRFEGIREPIDFARQIVPEGTRAGISMVVRLSQKQRPLPQNFPIALKLLTLADVVKILGSAYFAASTARDAVPSLAQVRRLHEEVATRMAPEPVPGLREEDVWDIRGYFATRFGDVPLYRALSAAGFWHSLARIAPYLANDTRGRFIGLLWGGSKPFTRAFVHLADVLASIGSGTEANCALDAILSLDPRTGKFSRRTDSVISGETVHRLALPDDQTVVVCNEFGHWISVPRVALAALGAEVRLPIPGWSNDLLDKADILEVPGIDHRESVPGLAKALTADATLLGRLFMRAKAVYLLDSYGGDHKITSMVLCLDPGTRKVGELASLVANWVDISHGRDAPQREHHDNALFVALTKIDKVFAETTRSARERSDDLAARIAEVLRDGFGRDFAWPAEWTPSRPFDNVLLVRNPAYKAKHLIDYTQDGREKGLKATQSERIERARREFLASDIASAHVADPAAAWREAFTLNDGGISYLAQAIGAVTDSRVKQRQLVHALTELRQAMKDRLTRYYVSDNYAFQHDRRRTTGLAVARRLKGCAENRRFGHLLRSLQLTDADFADVLANVGVWSGKLPQGAPAASAASTPAPGSASASIAAAAIGGAVEAARAAQAAGEIAAAEAAPPAMPASAAPPTSKLREAKADARATDTGDGAGDVASGTLQAQQLARTALNHWIETVRTVPLAATAPRNYQMPRQALAYLVDEIIAGANRQQVEQRVAAHIEQVTASSGDSDDRVARAALCVANAVGDFVMTLGFDDTFSNSHPRRRGHQQTPIFPPRNTRGLTALADSTDHDKEFVADWTQAFMTLVDDNATGLREGDIDDEQNRKLGRLLRLLDVTL